MSASLAVLLFLGIGVGPYGLGLVAPQLLGLLDPGIAVAATLIGSFVGLSVATSYPASRVTAVLLVVGGGLVVAALRSPSPIAAIGYMVALSVISIAVALAGWLLVGNSSSDNEQHAFVAGTLLLIGGAATYLSLSAALAGFVAGITWSVANNLAKARIVRDLGYLHHPLVVLALFAAGATARISLVGVMLACGLLFVASLVNVLTRRFAGGDSSDNLSPMSPLGLVAIALSLDLSRSDARPEWSLTLLGAVVIAAMAFGLFSSVRVRSA